MYQYEKAHFFTNSPLSDLRQNLSQVIVSTYFMLQSEYNINNLTGDSPLIFAAYKIYTYSTTDERVQ